VNPKGFLDRAETVAELEALRRGVARGAMLGDAAGQSRTAARPKLGCAETPARTWCRSGRSRVGPSKCRDGGSVVRSNSWIGGFRLRQVARWRTIAA